MTPGQLSAALGCPLDRAALWLRPLLDAMDQNGITSTSRAAAFLAQIGHESGRLRYTREIWGPTLQQTRYERNAEAAWPPTKADDRNKLAWALGNSEPGDGFRYRGRGLIQITGRTNTRACSMALFGDDRLIHKPALLEAPATAAMSAAWFWEQKGLNELADAGEFEAITRRINGGTNGLPERLALLAKTTEALA